MMKAIFPALVGFLSGLSLLARPVYAQELTQRTQIRVGAVVQKKVVKDVRAFVNPELRTDTFNPDRYLLEFGLRYKPIDYFAVRGAVRGDLEETNNGIEHGFRPRVAATGYLPLDDFQASLRLQYQYSFGPERNRNHRLHYRAQLEYDIPKVPLDVGVSAEPFQQLNRNPGFYKMRYAAEVAWKFYGTKKLDQWLLAGYMLDYFLDRRLNVHIPTINYKVRF